MTGASKADLKSVLEAESVLDSTPVVPLRRSVGLAEAQGLRLAGDLLADRDAPPFEKSLMDGYAVHEKDLRTMQILHLVGEIAAGRAADLTLQNGQTVSIMTGASLPNGADGVVPVEDARLLENGRVEILRVPESAARFVSRRGADCRKGEVVLHRGALLEAPQLAVAASVGASVVDVYAPPRVAVLCTGDELVDIAQTPSAWQIRNCNEIMLAALLKKMGCQVRTLGRVGDDVGLIRERIQDGLNDDALFITGGMSMGKYDHVPAILADLKIDVKISKLRIKPGKPFVFGVASSGQRACHVFGLPGNPVSAFVCTVRLAARLLRRLGGGEPDGNWISASLDAPLPANGGREFYQPALVNESRVRPLDWKGSADIYTLARANALLVRPENDPPRAAGETVQLMGI